MFFFIFQFLRCIFKLKSLFNYSKKKCSLRETEEEQKKKLIQNQKKKVEEEEEVEGEEDGEGGVEQEEIMKIEC